MPNTAFNLDKVADSLKELNIRAKDGSKTTMDAYTALGLNAEEMSMKFAQGGKQAQEATSQIFQALSNLDDPLKRNQIGVALMGSQFEDMEANTILALSNVQNKVDATADTLNKINEVKYNSIGEALTGIKRNLETSILLPIGDQVLPIFNELASWIQSNMPQIKSIIGNTLNFTGTLFTTVGSLVGAFIGVLQFFYSQNKQIFDGVALIIKTAFNIITSIFKVVTALLKGDWDTFGKELLNLTENIFKLIENIFNLGLTTIKTLLSNTIGSFQYLGNLIMNALYNAFRGVWSSVTNWLSSAISNAVSSVKGFSSNFYYAGSQLFSSFWDGIKSIWSNISSWVSDKVSWINNKLSSWRSVVNVMSGRDNIPAYAVGTPYVPNDQIALIHKGEAIIPAKYNPYNPANNSKSNAVMSPVINNSITFNVNGSNGISNRDLDKASDYMFKKISSGLSKLGK